MSKQFRSLLSNPTVESCDFTLRQIALMEAVYDGPARDFGVRELTAEMQINKPTVTRSLQKLHNLGLLKREADPKDGRLVQIKRTRDGMKLMAAIGKIVGVGT